jgi:hypothetical protein
MGTNNKSPETSSASTNSPVEAIICAWCKIDLQTAKIYSEEELVELIAKGAVSHGACVECKDQILKEFQCDLKKLSLDI